LFGFVLVGGYWHWADPIWVESLILYQENAGIVFPVEPVFPVVQVGTDALNLYIFPAAREILPVFNKEISDPDVVSIVENGILEDNKKGPVADAMDPRIKLA
jgi:hypothetical protein